MVGVVRQSQWKLGFSCQRQKAEMELEVSPISLGVPCDRGAIGLQPQNLPSAVPTLHQLFQAPANGQYVFFVI